MTIIDPQFVRNELKQALENVFFTRLAIAVVRLIDLATGDLTGNLESLDAPLARASVVGDISPDDYEKVLDQLAEDNRVRDACIYGAGQRPSRNQTKVRLREEIGESYRLYYTDEPEDLFQRLWRHVADEIQRDLEQLLSSPDLSDPATEDAVLPRLLLISFFDECCLPSARLMSQQLSKLTEPMNGLCSTLTKIPRSIPRVPTMVPPTSTVPPISLASNSLLAQSAKRAAADIASREGLLQRVVGSRPTHFFPENDPKQRLVIDGRKRQFFLSEANASILLFSATAEQFLRSHAERAGVDVSRNGHPIGIPRVARTLHQHGHISDATLDAADLMFGDLGVSIRNRSAHGALIISEAKWLESVLDHGGTIQGMESIDISMDIHSPAMLAEHAQNLCSVIASDIENRGTNPISHQDWCQDFGINKAIEFARGLRFDLVESVEEGKFWMHRLHQFLRVSIPHADLYFRAGMIAWLNDASVRENDENDFGVGLYFCQSVFESLYRTVAKMLGFSILRVSEGRDGVHNFDYRMLSGDTKGLAQADIIKSMVTCVDAGDRDTAAQLLRHAVALRDASAHGAIIELDEDDRRQTAKIIWKAVQLLCEAGIWHMTREAAYFRFQLRGASHGFDEADWEAASEEIERLLDSLDEWPTSQRSEILSRADFFIPTFPGDSSLLVGIGQGPL